MYIIYVKRCIVRSIKMQIKKKDGEECFTAGVQVKGENLCEPK